MSHHTVVVKCNTHHAYDWVNYSSYISVSEIVIMEVSLKICQRKRTHQSIQEYICEDSTAELVFDRQGKNVSVCITCVSVIDLKHFTTMTID